MHCDRWTWIYPANKLDMTYPLQMLLISNLSKCIFLFKWQWEKQTDFNYSKCSKWQILVAINTINGRCINRNCRQSQNKSIINRQLIVFDALNYNKSLVLFPLPQPKVLANLLFKTLSYWSYLYSKWVFRKLASATVATFQYF